LGPALSPSNLCLFILINHPTENVATQ
jgi:hypothetical protein